MLGALDYTGKQVARAVESVMLDHRVDRVEPLARLASVNIGAGAVGSFGVESVGHRGGRAPDSDHYIRRTPLRMVRVKYGAPDADQGS